MLFTEDILRIGKSRGTYVVGRIQHTPHGDTEYTLQLFAQHRSTEEYPDPDSLVAVSKAEVMFFPWMFTRPVGGETKILSPQPSDECVVANFIMALATVDTTRADFKAAALYSRVVEGTIGAHVAEDCGILTGDGAPKVALFALGEMSKLMQDVHRITEKELLAQVENLDLEIKVMKERRRVFMKELKKFNVNREKETRDRSKRHCYCFSLPEQKKVNGDRIFKELKR